MNNQPMWQALTGIQRDGTILPGPAVTTTDRMTVRKVREMVYRVHNVTKGYVCFVTLRKHGPSKQAQCDHDRCTEFCQPAGRLCKHIRRVVKHHVRQKGRQQVQAQTLTHAAQAA